VQEFVVLGLAAHGMGLVGRCMLVAPAVIQEIIGVVEGLLHFT